MRVRRLRLMILGLVGLCILAGIGLLVTVLNRSGQGPVYRGKHIGVWFREYAFSSNAPVLAQTIGARFAPNGQVVLTQIRNGTQVNIIGPTNPAALSVWFKAQVGTVGTSAPDPALEALQAIGPDAVPYLVSQLRSIPFEPTYTRAYTNLPAVLRKPLSNPLERHYLRVRALEALSSVGDPSGMATPVLLDLLRKRDPVLQFALYATLRRLHVDRRLINQVALDLAAKGRYEAAVQIAENLGWEGDEMAKLFGTVLKSPDLAMRRRAIVLLERSGNEASPALDAILAALADSDSEVRYLSVRALEGMGASSSEVVKALQGLLDDSNPMVQTVARRILSKVAPQLVPLEASP